MRGMDSGDEKVTLSAADAAAVDALLNGEAGGEPARRERVQAWLNVLDRSPMPEPAGDLAARALAAVQAERMRLPSGDRATGAAGSQDLPTGAAAPLAQRARTAARWGWRRRLAEVGAMAVAAMLLLAVTLEGIGQARRSNARQACAANLKEVAAGFGNYASLGGEGALPMIALPTNKNWLRGNAETGAANNAAHLLPLVTGQYLAIKALFCAGAGIPDGPVAVGRNELPAIGYSYRNMYGTEKPKWDGRRTTIVMTDKNPIFGEDVRPEWDQKNSFNHDGKGNYVVRADGTVSWETSPNLGPSQDNIWTIGSGKERVTVYTGREVPVDVADVLVCP
jgi:hypothetical protein